MRSYFLTLLVTIFILSAGRASAEDSIPLKMVNNFFQNLSEKDESIAIEELLKNGPADLISNDDKSKIKTGLKNLVASSGKFYSFKVITEKNITGVVTYICGYACFDTGPFQFEFVFYKKGDIYQCQRITLVDDILPLIRKLSNGP